MALKPLVPAVLAALLVLAGCATAPESPGDDRALSASPSLDRDNPWGKRTLTVGIDNEANESRNFAPLVADALAYWENQSGRHAEYPIEYELVPNATRPDVVIEVVEDIGDCARVANPVGCAPYVTDEPDGPVAVEMVAGYTNDSTRLILKHELGHTLGINHSEGPPDVMAPTSDLKTLPRPNATDRPLPWTHPNLTVYLDADNATSPPVRREQVRQALAYYDTGADRTLPANLSFSFTANRTTADIVVAFVDEPPCETARDGSCGFVNGPDPDDDGALETYRRLRITLTDVGDTASWHVGYWLGYGFGFRNPSEWPAPFRNTSHADRRGTWWRSNASS